ncbi:4-hydroxy-tetrahydrodipicolinate reductase [Algimonas arctica]|uniref:4-hydroxy-tetrahydrodipicolinate reductase n=1 Tax=Algimonas arctica TaxID=1479486 RepID=A0A8J3G1J0_9PROT|nr:4-hydroxy-tetrahydrodipicolinate reductase [Algimonas arctica]GHA86522.1 4-hydroxy-tetrahydrodipicolinate reductase [Algimonas arctica]
MTDSTPRIGILGADGRMGRAVEAACEGRFDVAARITLANPDYESLSACDVVIDFSAASALVAALAYLKPGTALVSGTTGLSDTQEAVVSDAASRLPLLRSGNFSVGIAVLSALARQATATLGVGWDIEILEMHHRHKVDAPSGTALMLGDACAKGRDVSLATVAVQDRDGPRRDGDIGFAVLRGGGVYGNHEVRIVSESEMITLGHQALNRDVFAHGALSAADWLIGRAPGLYTMNDLIKT